MRRTLASLLLIAAWGAADAQVHVLLSQRDAPYESAGRAAAAAAGPGATVGIVGEPVPAAARMVIAVGMAAADAAVRGERPVVATLVPEAGWRSLPTGAAHTAIFLDQPLARQVALVRAVLPPARELAVLFGPASRGTEPALQQAARRWNFRVHAATVDDFQSANGELSGLLRSSEVLLALPDPSIYNRYTVQSILLATFRLRRPVIGFSEALVRAGALAAVHSTPEQLGTEAGSTAAEWLQGSGPLPPAAHPRQFTLSVNRQVAFSLGISLPPDAVLLQSLQAAEDAP